MQTSIYLPCSSVPFLSTKLTSTFLFPAKHRIKTSSSSTSSSYSIAIKAAEVDYSSMKSSVFPAEACEILGGVACDVEMFPETKPKEANTASSKHKVTTTDREYLQYDSPKTVFIAEACDDLGGEFCEPAYQYQSD
ncbi:putative light regulated Lir1 [Helianthus annuus]|uniref:Light regulated Lir1 n=1 Tax=Helianthus annuus TaxID=4232 RepID=A0A251RVN1_HELAN|nr:light-regulated protein, chloroplastic [Helianthus annuus]KAF5757604.1 putative light regulated Lir1 [Helianthus annuus]KAJ0436037.1 putative light regulated Lir1 [Helianthus annuus]KAJ0449415.1 putative light regulated Lir1 [Helianthus annuus]KAJ0629841.1 putative light regulated Lir1 [Helianthus annuus]KAJ0828625.1 putative light regulated Lir1 [Helianthus annuus]